MKPLPKELETRIDELKSWMVFDGDQVKVARLSRESESRVSQMLNKKIPPSKRFIEAATEVMNENKDVCGIQPKMEVA